MLIIVACPLPFIRENKMIQENAILSWKKLNIKKKIVITANEIGTKEFCDLHKLIHEPDVTLSKWGTPLIPSVFNMGIKHSENENDIIMYINCDIILLDDYFSNTIKLFDKIKEKNHIEKYLLVGNRFDWFNPRKLNYDKLTDKKIKDIVISDGKDHGPSGIDYFIFSKKSFKKIPSFGVGRDHYDRHLVFKAINENLFTVNMTDTIFAIHQDYNFKKYETKIKEWKNSSGVFMNSYAENGKLISEKYKDYKEENDYNCYNIVDNTEGYGIHRIMIKSGIKKNNLIFYK